MKLLFRTLQWLTYLALHLLIILARYPLAPIAVGLFSSKDKRHLTFMRWLETIDNDLAGDKGWKTEHTKPGSDPLSYWNRVGWLWRNGGNTLNYRLLGCQDDPDFRRIYSGLERLNTSWIRSDDYWMINAYIPIGKRYLNLFWGWSLFGPIEGKCKFTASIRRQDKKPGR